MQASQHHPRPRGAPPGKGLEKENFSAFYRRHVGAVTGFMARRVSDPHTVVDLTADVFLAAIRSAHTYDPGAGSEIGWLYGIARHVVAAEARRSDREAGKVRRIAGHRLLDSDDIGRLEERLDAESVGRRTREAMAGLPEGERAALELVAVDQLTVAEAAQALGVRQVTVRVRLHRARKALRAAAENTTTDTKHTLLATARSARGEL